jgi:hypothetical protein
MDKQEVLPDKPGIAPGSECAEGQDCKPADEVDIGVDVTGDNKPDIWFNIHGPLAKWLAVGIGLAVTLAIILKAVW